LFAIIVIHDIIKGGFDIRRYLFIGNFYNLSIQYFYFIEVLFQCFLIISLIMTIRPVREYAKQQPWRTGLLLFAAAVAVHFIGLYVSNLILLDYRVPQFYLYLVIYGWCLHFATDIRRRYLALVAALIVFPATIVSPPETFWLIVGSMLLLFVPKVSIHGTARWIVASISGATFYIYVVHGVPIALLRKPELALPSTVKIYLALASAILIGTALARGVPLAIRLLATSLKRLRSSSTRLPASARQDSFPFKHRPRGVEAKG
jgi:hypothetical protein